MRAESGFVAPPDADDVALVDDARGRLHLAASAASLGEEVAYLAEVDSGGVARGAIPIGRAGTRTFRPALCRHEDGVLAVACAGDRLAGLWLRAGHEPVRWDHALTGSAWHVALAAGDEARGAWIAVELRRPGERRIAIGRIDPATGERASEVELGGGASWCRWPALVALPGPGCLAAWCQGDARGAARVLCSPVGGAVAPIAADPAGGPGEAPALALAPDGSAVVAWHVGGASLTDGLDRHASVRRAIRLSRWSPAAGSIDALLPPPDGPGGADPRGEDQSWELPAVAVDPGGAIWLAGRSSHGHQLARLAGGRWSRRVSLCHEGWGGRGRRLALIARQGGVTLARRAPDGIEVRPCSVPPDADGGQASPAPLAPPHPIRRPARPRRVLFGDLHQHTAHSDGCGSAEDLWIAARDRRGLDFAAVTDHDRFCRRSLGPATWRYLCDVADDFDEPGRFAALRGYEFTGARHPGPGHKCVYFGDRAPERVPDKEVAAIFAAARDCGGIAIPHHVGWTGGDFAHHDPSIQPVWEVCSVHGCYERAGGCAGRPPRADAVLPGQFVRDALEAGLRFGFIASTDHHGLDWHHGIAPRRNPLTCGLACLVDAEPTRAGVLAALRARRTYGTTGARIALRVEVDGAAMGGSDLPAGTRGEVAVEVDTGGVAAAVERVVLVTGRGESVLGGGPDPVLSVRGPLPEPDRAGFYFYVRIELADGEQAWASPFWIG